jgi:hypothetical protein
VQSGVSVTEAVEVGVAAVGVAVSDADVAVSVPEGVRVVDTVAVVVIGITVGEGESVPVADWENKAVGVREGAGVGLIPIKSSGGTVGG